MSLKKSRILAIILTFILAFLCHFVYDILPNFITSIFFPVNESIWEHMKILYTSIIIYSFIDYYITKKNNSFFFNLFIISFSSIIIYLCLFLPIYYKIGENMFISIFLMLIVYIIVYILSYYILKKNKFQYKLIPIILIIIGYIIFSYLTYKPIHTNLFYDPLDEIYGIKKLPN